MLLRGKRLICKLGFDLQVGVVECGRLDSLAGKRGGGGATGGALNGGALNGGATGTASDAVA